MAHSIKCTNCGAILKTANPIAPGKKIKCPKCLKPFVVMAEDEEEDIGAEDAGAENEIPKSKKPAKVMDDEESAGDDEDEMPKMKGKGGDKAKRKGKDDENGAKPKKKSSSLLLIIIGVVLLFCCIGCTTVGWIFQATLNGTGRLFP